MLRPGRVSSRRLTLYAVELLICGVISLPLGSCSILLPVGAVQSNRRFPPGDLDVMRTKELKGSAPLTIVTRSGGTFAGEFKGIHPMPREEYAPRYAAWRAAHANVPDLGEEVTLATPRGPGSNGRFEGFGVRTVLLTVGRHDLRAYPMEEFETLRLASGTTLRSDSLLAHAAELPMRLELKLHSPPGDAGSAREVGRGQWVRVPLSDIARVEIRGRAASVAGALGAGILLDWLTLVAMSAAIDHMWDGHVPFIP